MTPPPWKREMERQRRSNENALEHRDLFANHRRHLTELLLARAAARSAPIPARLCVLGAGNCGDLDLPELAASYASIHLVDVDEQALDRAVQRSDPTTRATLVTHAPVELSGLVDSVERWRDGAVSVDEILNHPELTSARVAARLDAPYDVVLSACVLSQLHFAALNVFSDRHRLFDAVNYTLTLTHLRTLARLTAPGGVAILVSDVASDEMAPLRAVNERTDLRALLARQMSSGGVFGAVRPDLITHVAQDDPSLRLELGPARLADVWTWQSGPRRSFLVYALAFQRVTNATPIDAPREESAEPP